MLIEINPFNPQPRLIAQVVEILKNGGVIAYPTDTTYGIGCSILNKKALERIYRIKQRERNKPVSFICADLSEISHYAQVSNFAFKTMKRFLPGPYTFILEASRTVPDLLMTRQKTVGIRVPDNIVCQGLLSVFGRPIISTSACLSDQDFLNDPEEIAGTFANIVDLFLDTGPGGLEPSTIIDFTQDEPVVVRQGKGPVA